MTKEMYPDQFVTQLLAELDDSQTHQLESSGKESNIGNEYVAASNRSIWTDLSEDGIDVPHEMKPSRHDLLLNKFFGQYRNTYKGYLNGGGWNFGDIEEAIAFASSSRVKFSSKQEVKERLDGTTDLDYYFKIEVLSISDWEKWKAGKKKKSLFLRVITPFLLQVSWIIAIFTDEVSNRDEWLWVNIIGNTTLFFIWFLAWGSWLRRCKSCKKWDVAIKLGSKILASDSHSSDRLTITDDDNDGEFDVNLYTDHTSTYEGVNHCGCVICGHTWDEAYKETYRRTKKW